MLQYKPWSEEELDKGLDSYKKKQFYILDIELSGSCNFNCMYCDSPDRRKRCTIDIRDIERIISEGFFEWIYICGLGEPTVGKNYIILLQILALCKKYNTKCSMFSNIYYLPDELLKYVDEGILYILFKYDSLDYELNANMYNVSRKKAKIQHENIAKLSKHVITDKALTNIGASIVTTRLNVKSIPAIIDYCIDNSIYPLIADLENSGRGQQHFSSLSLAENEISELKLIVETKLGGKYRLPICPAVVAGIHISYDSKVVVDQRSGLTCPWFWLEEPKLHTIMQFTKGVHLEDIMEKIIAYRKDRIIEIDKIYSTMNARTFGGCGGNIKDLLNKYIEVHKECLI